MSFLKKTLLIAFLFWTCAAFITFLLGDNYRAFMICGNTCFTGLMILFALEFPR